MDRAVAEPYRLQVLRARRDQRPRARQDHADCPELSLRRAAECQAADLSDRLQVGRLHYDAVHRLRPRRDDHRLAARRRLLCEHAGARRRHPERAVVLDHLLRRARSVLRVQGVWPRDWPGQVPRHAVGQTPAATLTTSRAQCGPCVVSDRGLRLAAMAA